MPKHFIFLFLFLPTLTFSQSAEIIEEYCDCKGFYNFIEDEDCSITFIRQEGRNDFGSRLFIETIVEGPNNTWEPVDRKEIVFDNISTSEEERARDFQDYYDGIFSTESNQQMRKISLDGEQYYYAILELYKRGTAYGGSHRLLFVFYNLEREEDPQVIYFEKWDSTSKGEWRQMGNLSTKAFELFKKQASIYIDERFYSDEDPYAWENYLKEWNELNPNLHDDLREDRHYTANFLTFETEEFYNKMKEKFPYKEQENDAYRLFDAGFSPIFGYNKNTDKSFIVFVPQAWPSGGAIGMREIVLRKLTDNKVIIGNPRNNDEDDDWTEVNLKTGKMRLVKWNEIKQ
ncbi:MAG TPA: hypothetical protein VK021_04680 [Flavobacteriaceae bacterium]|nr:hypothetical protein [Flavobacteriaceae bacterium]